MRIAETVAGLPVDDHRSPLTGWTRDHHRVVADRSLLALRRWASPGHARFALPGPASNAGLQSDGLEAFARSFLTAGFLLAGDDDEHDHAAFYAAGLAAGPDPTAADRWPRLGEVRQARVEAAALVIALHESRAQVWDRLDSSVRERLVDWLAESIGGHYGDSNWRWFQNVTQAFLRSVGGPYDQAEIEENLDFLDHCYLGDGWYSDGRPGGRGGNVDWYNAWVMHLFSLWYCRILGDQAPPDRFAAARERLAAFLPQGVRLFGARGAPLFQGRSLVYRFATTAAIWAGPVFGVDTVVAGVVRRVGSGALRWFVEQGCYDADDVLSLGWRGRFEPMRQGYSGPGSPYWASLGFAGLVLGGDHPVWTEVEQEVADDGVAAVGRVGWLVGRGDGIVRVVNHGVDHAGPEPLVEDPQYCRYGYTDVTAPVPLAVGTGDEPVDNQVALVDDRGRWSHRRPLEPVTAAGATAVSRHRARWTDDGERWDDGPELITGSVLRGTVEIRAVLVGSGPGAERGDRLVISGFALPAGESRYSGRVAALAGDLLAGIAEHEVANPFGDRLEVPYVATTGAAEPGTVYVAAVVLGADGPAVELPELVVEGVEVTVRWADGEQDRLRLE